MAQLESLSKQTETLSEVLGLVETFRAFDADNDGFISAAELGGIMDSLGYGVSEEELQAMMQQGDLNGDGLLSVEEFLQMNTQDMELGDLASLLGTSFEALGVNGGEAVTGEELFEVLGNMGVGFSLEDCQDIVSSMDGDGDGVVSFEDFKLIVNSFL